MRPMLRSCSLLVAAALALLPACNYGDQRGASAAEGEPDSANGPNGPRVAPALPPDDAMLIALGALGDAAAVACEQVALVPELSRP